MKISTKALDQFYTNPKIISPLLDILEKNIFGYVDFENASWLEPSAGSGNFIDALQDRYGYDIDIEAYDLEPKSHNLIKKANYLKMNFNHSKNRITIGNPPFGKRSSLAIEFMNKSMEHSDVVAFILPNQFVRFLTQQKINEKFKLISQSKIEKDSFIVDDRKYNVNCVFQIWVNSENEFFKNKKNLRKLTKPKTTHSDFELMTHNNTQQTLKYFDKNKYKWTFAIHRQGYYDFEKLISKEEELIKNRQYLFIKCNEKKYCKNIVKEMNKTKMTEWSTSVPGFSNEDFVKEYERTKKIYIRKEKNGK